MVQFLQHSIKARSSRISCVWWIYPPTQSGERQRMWIKLMALFQLDGSLSITLLRRLSELQRPIYILFKKRLGLSRSPISVTHKEFKERWWYNSIFDKTTLLVNRWYISGWLIRGRPKATKENENAWIFAKFY